MPTEQKGNMYPGLSRTIEAYVGTREYQEATLAFARRNPERLQEIRDCYGDLEWAKKLGEMVGTSLPDLFKGNADGEAASITMRCIGSNLYELEKRPDLMPSFMSEFTRWLEIQQVLTPNPR
jgi:hypothetical protein